MKSPVTRFDEKLVADARRFVSGLAAEPALRAELQPFGFDEAALRRGRTLVEEAERAFEWERAGRAWNYISSTPERREREARYWHRDALRRHRQRCFRAAARELGTRRSPGAIVRAARHVLEAYSVRAWLVHRRELGKELARGRGERPADAPLPKDTLLVEISGWYERWSLVARRVLLDRPELLAPLGLAPGRAPRRVRNPHDRLAQLSLARRAVGPSETGE
jgi:hypothetical protein